MEPNWLRWLRDNMPPDLKREFDAEWKHNSEWRDELIGRLKAENTRLVVRMVTCVAPPVEVLVGSDEMRPYDILSPDLRKRLQEARSTLREIAAEWTTGQAQPRD